MVTFLPALPDDHPKRPEWMDLSWAQESPHLQKVTEESGRLRAMLDQLLAAARRRSGNVFLNRTVPVAHIREADAADFKEIITDAVPVTGANAGLYDHLHMAGAFAREICTALGGAKGAPNPHLADAAMFTHDIGKLSGIFRYHFHDLVGERMLEDMHVRGEVRSIHQPARFNIGPLRLSTYNKTLMKNRAIKIEAYANAVYKALTLQQKIGIVADVSGKRSKREIGRVWTWEEMSHFHLSTRKTPEAYAAHIGQQAIWPSEIYAMERIPDWALGWMGIYNRAKAELESMGVNLDDIRKQVQDTVPLPA